MDSFFVTTYLTRSSTLRKIQFSYRHAYPTCNALIVKKIYHLLRHLSKSILHTHLSSTTNNTIASANSVYLINFQRYLSRLSVHWIIYWQNNYNAKNNSRELIFRDYSIISSRWIDLSRRLIHPMKGLKYIRVYLRKQFPLFWKKIVFLLFDQVS